MAGFEGVDLAGQMQDRYSELVKAIFQVVLTAPDRVEDLPDLTLNSGLRLRAGLDLHLGVPNRGRGTAKRVGVDTAM